MCGIAGLFEGGRRGGTAAGDQESRRRADIAAMIGALRHRGPDAAGCYVGGPTALGAARLSIIDLSEAGNQPMHGWGRWVVYNGEIYNYIEIRRELEALYDFRTHTDTEVILAAYDRWGEDCVSRFNGMFAFIIWDEAKQVAFGARDRLGVKPLYYAMNQETGEMAFASEIKALRTLSWCRGAPNPQRLYDFLIDRVSDHTDQTMFDGIRQIQPGCVFAWSPEEGLRTRRYWRYAPTAASAPPLERVYDTFRELLFDAVHLRLRSDVPVGCLLSGGIDSSSIYCAARPHAARNGQPIYSFSTRVDPPTSENTLIDVLVASDRQYHFEDRPGRHAFEQDLAGLIYAQEEPFGDGSMLAHFRLMRFCREAGVKVVLSGQGGDELWDGYYGSIWNFLATLLRERRVREYRDWLRGFTRRYRFQPAMAMVEAVGHAVPTGFVDAYRERSFRRRNRWFDQSFFAGCRREREPEPSGPENPYRRYLRNLVAAWTLPGFLHYEDRNSMFFGVEARLPFLDYRLVEFAGTLVPEIKMRDCETKHVVRAAMKGHVPDAVLTRHDKQPWPAPLQDWLREPGGVLDEVQDKSRDVPFARPAAVERLVAAYRQGSAQMVDAWRMACAILWYHRFFVERIPPSGVASPLVVHWTTPTMVDVSAHV